MVHSLYHYKEKFSHGLQDWPWLLGTCPNDKLVTGRVTTHFPWKGLIKKNEGSAKLVWINVTLPSKMQCEKKKCSVKTRGGGWRVHRESLSQSVRVGLCRRLLLTQEGALGHTWAQAMKRPMDFRSLVAGPGTEHPYHLNASGLEAETPGIVHCV